ncbi:MAG: hypothetical protein Q8O19_06465 [Rectinemataceae bacterium]|nr:hypothetical protein [Rectinemataceae bacterium]
MNTFTHPQCLKFEEWKYDVKYGVEEYRHYDNAGDEVVCPLDSDPNHYVPIPTGFGVMQWLRDVRGTCELTFISDTCIARGFSKRSTRSYSPRHENKDPHEAIFALCEQVMENIV